MNKRVFLSPPDVGDAERQLLLDAFDSNWIAPLGPHVDAFEREFAESVGVPYAVALSSGTAALHLGLHVLGIGRGDDVLTSTMTFAATANAVTYVGATPVFVDVARRTWTMDPDLLEEELEQRARTGRRQIAAVLSVDLYGQCCDYDRIAEICGRFGVPLIEDAAEALGATHGNKSAGAFGECAAFSFNGNKIITTSGGGMLVSHRREVIDRVRHLSTQARDAAPHYQHSSIGYNYRLSNLLAAVGRGQLQSLANKVTRRRIVNRIYWRGLDAPGIEFMPEAAYGVPNCWLTCITVDPSQFEADREDIRLVLEHENIESRPLWKPMHMQPVFAPCSMRGGRVSEDLFARGLCLPSGSSLTPAEQERVMNAVLEAPARISVRAVGQKS
jgi:dTDP-4-amino-4,6-dideoxygalactose transaminase